MLDPGAIIANRYRIISQLGSGGMGSVYLASDCDVDNQLVAIKILSVLSSHDEVAIERFRQEVFLARKLTHENIVSVFDFGATDEAHHFLVMEYVRGRSLAVMLRDGPMPFDLLLRILFGVARALAVAHASGIIHRDLKPANVMFSKDGVVKLADFGLATSVLEDKGLTKPEQILGTASYMSPEQWMKGPVDARSDIYSFGLLAYELATGKKPYEAERPEQLMFRHLSVPLPKLERAGGEIPSWFDSFVRRCAEKSP